MRLLITTLATLAVAATIVAALAAQQPDKPPLPKGQMPELGRPTKVGDELPLFDFDAYFPGTWTFEWDMPEGALGESGSVTGSDDLQGGRAGETVSGRHHGDRAGRTVHHPRRRSATRRRARRCRGKIADSRGFAYTQSGTIGGDLGGIYNILLDGTPFTYNGHTVRIKQAIRTMSPFNYKVATDGLGRRRAVQELRQPVVAQGHDRREMTTPNRWLPVVGGVMMNMALGMFYGMSVFMLPLEKEFGWTRAQTSWVSTIGLALIAVWYVIAGFIQDRRGPRPVAVIGGLLFSLGFFLASYTRRCRCSTSPPA